jgi:hypothetical protein
MLLFGGSVRTAEMDARKVSLGALFLFVSSVTTIEAGLVSAETPVVAAAVGSLALAAGSLIAESLSATLSV